MTFTVREVRTFETEDGAGITRRNEPIAVWAEGGEVKMETSDAKLTLTLNQAKDLLFSTRKAIYEAGKEKKEYREANNNGWKGGAR